MPVRVGLLESVCFQLCHPKACLGWYAWSLHDSHALSLSLPLLRLSLGTFIQPLINMIQSPILFLCSLLRALLLVHAIGGDFVESALRLAERAVCASHARGEIVRVLSAVQRRCVATGAAAAAPRDGERDTASSYFAHRVAHRSAHRVARVEQRFHLGSKSLQLEELGRGGEREHEREGERGGERR